MRKPPQFSGKVEEDWDSFLGRFEQYAMHARIARAQWAAAMGATCFIPDSHAAKWWATNKKQHTPEELQEWDIMLPIFEQRFRRAAQPAKLVRDVDELRCKAAEHPLYFADRVDEIFQLITQDVIMPQPADGAHDTPRHYTAFAERVRLAIARHCAKFWFVSGLPASLRDKMKSPDVGIAYASLKEDATRAFEWQSETAAANKGSALPMELSELAAEIDEIRQPRRGGRQPWAPRQPWQNQQNAYNPPTTLARGRGRRGRGQPRPYASYRDATTNARRPTPYSHLPPNVCARCGKQGHRARTCAVPERNYEWATNGLRRPSIQELQAELEMDDYTVQHDEDVTQINAISAGLQSRRALTAHFQ